MKSLLLPLLGAVVLAGCAHQTPDKVSLIGITHTGALPSTNTQSAAPEAPEIAEQSTTEPEDTASEKLDETKPTYGPPPSSTPFGGLLSSHEIKETKAFRDPPAPGNAPKSLIEVIRYAMEDNPDIGIALARELDEHYAIDVARAALHPTVNLRLANGPENYETETASTMGVDRSELALDLHQTIYDFGRAAYNINRRKALHNSASYRRLHKMNQIAVDVAKAYLHLLETTEHIRIAEENVSAHEEIHQLVEASHQAGNASVADVKRVTTRLEKAKTNLIDLRSRKQDVRQEFVNLTGIEPDRLGPPPNLQAPLPPPGMNSDDYPDNPELLSVRADIDSLRAQGAAAKANLKPTIDLDIIGAVKNDASGETGMTKDLRGMISFNYKLMDGEARANTARQIYARVTEGKHRYRKKRREYLQNLDSAIRTVRSSMEKTQLLKSRATDSRKVLDLYKAQFKDGTRTVFELLDALSDLFAANSELVTNRYGMLGSIYDIYSLRGDLVARLLPPDNKRM